MLKTSFSLILLAGGMGTRFGSSLPKQFTFLQGKPLALHSLQVLAKLDPIEIVVVCDKQYQYIFENLYPSLSFALPGEKRQDSLRNGWLALTKQSDLILSHDAARPFLTQEDIILLISEAHATGAATLATPLSFTCKLSDEQGFVKKTLDRSSLWEIQTPQALKPAIMKKGFEYLEKHPREITDDVQLAELTNHPVKLVKGSSYNLKVTMPSDLSIAETFLHKERSL